jgi:iron(III) transport system ATP-binding protein
MAGVTIRNVYKLFGKQAAVSDLSVEIKPGEFFTFLGPSGCGKTTTLRMIAGFSYPTRGSIFFDERDITYLAPNKRDIGMVFQSYALFPHLTVGENIAFGLKVRKLPRNEIAKKVDSALDSVHLGGLSKKKIHELSGGQQQRVALARAIVIEPDILLLDEPLSNLDAKLREDTRTEIKRIQMELGITTIYVTHDQAEAMALSDRIMVMKDGEIQQVGMPVEIFYRPSNLFVAQFIGKSNILTATVADVDGGKIVYRTDDGAILTGLSSNINNDLKLRKGDRVKLAMRPEAFRSASAGANLIEGIVELSEFTGVAVNYLIRLGNNVLTASFSDTSGEITSRGSSITLHYPENALYVVDLDESVKPREAEGQ